MTQPNFTIATARTTLGPVHHITFEIPGGVCAPAEFAQATDAALHGFVPTPGHGVVLDGRGPVWGYGMLVHSLHPVSWLAVRDPRLGLVVVASHTEGVRPGQILDFRNAESGGVVLAVCGPPHSGKSVFLAELYRQILARRPSLFCFLQRVAPDGEGMWSAESSPQTVKELRQKGSFTPEFTEFSLHSIDGLASVFPLLLIDMPGRRDAIAEALLDHASHVLVLSRSLEESEAWCMLARARGCEILAILESKQGGEGTEARSVLDVTSTPIRGQLTGLERGGSADSYRATVGELADWLIRHMDRLAPRKGRNASEDK